MEDLRFDVDSASELKRAFKRANGTNEDIKILSSGDNMAQILPFLRGKARIVMIPEEVEAEKLVIDLDADPYVPEGWTVEEHKKGGLVEYTPEMAKLFLAKEQKNGGYLEGHKLRKKLKDLPVANANLLDWYLANPDKIPEKWKGKAIFFWGTIYRDSDDSMVVRYLYWSGDNWYWGCGWFGHGFDGDSPAVVSASQS